MSVLIATLWQPSSSFYSGWLAMVTLVSAMACSIASLRKIHASAIGQLLEIVGAPILFVTVLFLEGGMFVLRDGRDFGFPIWIRSFPNASDFLATYVALGASYLMAREATRMQLEAVRIVGWIEVVGFALIGAFEIFLLFGRIYLD
ncbi:MAG TPA: hypothetical protein VG324_15125 [Blastocatellia bacterium]|nr:hypothetical protein [Blastocatellia bacterium]